MKIGILSMQKIENYGSVLQAYGLKKTIESMGHEVAFIDMKYNECDNSLLEGYKMNFVEAGKLGFSFSKINKYLINRIVNKIKEKRLPVVFNKFRNDYLDIDRKLEHFDLCVIGSDEVFNCLNSGWWGFTSQLFGNVSEADKVITYAASCGATTYEKLPLKVEERIRDSFQRISGFSVRDNNTKEFVSNFVDDAIVENIDPVLLYNYDSEVNRTDFVNVPKHYCIIYAYSNRFQKKEEYEAILSFCKKRGLTPIALCGQQFWCSKLIICGPFECLKLFSKADFVITDTFHGTIFSAKYANRFAVVLRDSNKNKLGDLVKRIGITEHVLEDFCSLDRVYNIEKDQTQICNLLEIERKKSMDYLREYL